MKEFDAEVFIRVVEALYPEEKQLQVKQEFFKQLEIYMYEKHTFTVKLKKAMIVNVLTFVIAIIAFLSSRYINEAEISSLLILVSVLAMCISIYSASEFYYTVKAWRNL